MIVYSLSIIAAMAIILFLTGMYYSCKRGYIIPSRIDIHCEIQAVPFLRPFSSKRAKLERAQLSQMQPAEAIGYRCSALCDAFIVERRKNLDRGDWAERGI